MLFFLIIGELILELTELNLECHDLISEVLGIGIGIVQSHHRCSQITPPLPISCVESNWDNCEHM